MFRSAQQSIYGLGVSLAATTFAQLMRDAGWTVCAVDLPCWSGCDRWADEPRQNEGMAHRLANGRSLWQPPGLQIGVRERALAGVNLLAAEGYVDLDNLWTAGHSIGGPFALNQTAFDARIRGAVLFHPVTEFLALYEFAAHPLPGAVAAEDVRHLAPQLVGRSLFVTINTADLRVNTDAAVTAVRTFVAANAPTETWVPDITLKLPTQPGHPSPASAYTEARDWLLARA
jgi:hypothetical protein